MGQNVGTLGIFPRQIAPNIREIETDDGEGTTLKVCHELDYLIFSIVQYDVSMQQVSESAPWKLLMDRIHIGVIVRNDQHWSLVGENNIILDLYKADDGDIVLCISDPAKGELPFRVPQFSLVSSGGKSPVVRRSLQEIVALLRREVKSEKKSIPTCYYSLVEVYNSIEQEKHFA